jgi:hypothetical protein
MEIPRASSRGPLRQYELLGALETAARSKPFDRVHTADAIVRLLRSTLSRLSTQNYIYDDMCDGLAYQLDGWREREQARKPVPIEGSNLSPEKQGEEFRKLIERQRDALYAVIISARSTERLKAESKDAVWPIPPFVRRIKPLSGGAVYRKPFS